MQIWSEHLKLQEFKYIIQKGREQQIPFKNPKFDLIVTKGQQSSQNIQRKCYYCGKTQKNRHEYMEKISKM